ncbi:hypothetical protein [Nocardia transvalensis]|uniref:hypothetical protein n=1 Tax=Nocardia transvalensis TaxID=37333 RepID=UPI001894533F|nr:hypothetical protein [Nocardia transvalensis]MBF6333658.1 hypothetical protein [Nocardia transvalensis]
MLEQPWKRSKTRADLPRTINVEAVQSLDDDTFAAILRDHLEPADTAAAYVGRWRQFWNLLSFDETLAERTADILDDFIDRTEEALVSGNLDEQQAKRANRFRDRCLKALDRLDRADTDPLGWAGARAAVFNPRARSVIAKLVEAIAEHRRQTGPGSPADQQLWSVLAAVRLDPDTDNHP